MLPRVNDSRSSIISYIDLATYRALVEPSAEPRKEICVKPFYVSLHLDIFLKTLWTTLSRASILNLRETPLNLPNVELCAKLHKELLYIKLHAEP